MERKDIVTIKQEMLQLLKGLSRLKWSQQPCPDLKPSECELLSILFLTTVGKSPPAVSASVLSTELQITPAGITHLVNPLEDAGYLQRQKDPNDRRKVLIGFTKKGYQLAESLIQIMLGKLGSLVDHLGEKDSREFVRIMSIVIEYLIENPLKR